LTSPASAPPDLRPNAEQTVTRLLEFGAQTDEFGFDADEIVEPWQGRVVMRPLAQPMNLGLNRACGSWISLLRAGVNA
jgi:hypothetical protein